MLASVTQRELEILTKSLKRTEALCIGDTTIVSTCVHTIDTSFNGSVYVNPKADAGQFFYKRTNKGEVVHIDIFHEYGHVPHLELAKMLKKGISYYYKTVKRKANSYYYGSKLEDYIDIQTATGGGRLSGSGRYGRNRRVKRNHLNHVHITLLLHPNNYDLILYLINSTEIAIKEQGLKLVAVQNVRYDEKSNMKQIGEEYESATDSLLHKEVRPRMTGIEGIDCQKILDKFTDEAFLTADWEFISGDSQDLKFHFDSSEVFLEDYKMGNKSFTKKCNSKYDNKMTGTKKIFNNKQKKIKQYSNYSVINNSTKYTNAFRSRSITANGAGSLAISKTVKKALVRNYSEHGFNGKFIITKNDLCYYQKPKQSYRNFLFLFDYSASMEGMKIRAACALIDRLLSWSRDKIAVISIQENNTRLQCAFTRNRYQLLATVKSLKPSGLTPLAEGIELAYDYINSNKYYQTEVVLISDGVPTVSRYGGDPVSEAEMEAAKLLSDNIKFTCVGVKPNQNIMKKIAKAGGGKLFITKDLREDILLQIFRREYERINPVSRIS